MTKKGEQRYPIVRNIRLSRAHVEKLEYLSERTRRPQAEILRMLIEMAEWTGESDIKWGSPRLQHGNQKQNEGDL